MCGLACRRVSGDRAGLPGGRVSTVGVLRFAWWGLPGGLAERVSYEALPQIGKAVARVLGACRMRGPAVPGLFRCGEFASAG